MPENGKKFNAFISYRHKPLDMAIATRLQRLLENFRLPGALKGGHKNIRRVFRDRAELPTTSNLIDSIYTSLDESEFLIVVCSSFTPESVYIEREVKNQAPTGLLCCIYRTRLKRRFRTPSRRSTSK